MTYGPPWRIDGPLPLPPRFGLLPTAEAAVAGVRIVTDVDDRGIERWMNGVQVWPYPTGLADTWDSCSSGSEGGIKSYGDDVPLPEFGALTVYLAESCSSYSIGDDQDAYMARATAALTAVESATVARELLTGTQLIANPHLADGQGTFPNADSATSVAMGIGLLEEEIAASGRLGLIHVSPLIMSMMHREWWFDPERAWHRTVNGNVVIADPGYRGGATPLGHAAPAGDQQWIYASGPVDIRRSEMFVTPDNVAEALDRGSGATNSRPNTITYRAERYYLVDWDTTVQAAVLVDPCSTNC